MKALIARPLRTWLLFLGSFAFATLICGCGSGTGSDTTAASGQGGSASSDPHCISTAQVSSSNGEASIPSLTSTAAVVEVKDISVGSTMVGYAIPANNVLSFQPYQLDGNNRCTTVGNSATSFRSSFTALGDSGNRFFVDITNTSPTIPTAAFFCYFSGTGDCTPNAVRIAGQVEDENGKPLAKMTLSVPNNGQRYSAQTDNYGNYFLEVPNSSSLPSSFIATFYDPAGLYNPVSVPLTNQPNHIAENMNLRSVAGNPRLLSLELIPDVHHIGDSNYSGSENSQFQYPNAAGTSFNLSFTVSAAQKAYAAANMSLLAKGVQCSDEVYVNGTKVQILVSSSPDGTYSPFNFAINPALLVQGGNNNLTIKSMLCASGDYDDFEFTNVQIQFQ